MRSGRSVFKRAFGVGFQGWVLKRAIIMYVRSLKPQTLPNGLLKLECHI